MIKKVKNLAKEFLVRRKRILIREMTSLGRERRISLSDIVKYDYIRTSTIELVANEIYEMGIDGQVAELGVYRGDFAQYINILFPDRLLYLFDTFEGFNEIDIEYDKIKGFNPKNIDFSATEVNLVLTKMQHKENCIVKKGYFPESLEGLEENFCFVSIDADSYKPIYEGLNYFYPRLNKGGYIFVHDFNQSGFNGAKGAVRTFCEENSVCYTPLTDVYGSVVITKK